MWQKTYMVSKGLREEVYQKLCNKILCVLQDQGRGSFEIKEAGRGQSNAASAEEWSHLPGLKETASTSSLEQGQADHTSLWGFGLQN